MPRAASFPYTYSLPAVYLAVPGTTILVDQHNAPLEDIAATLNTVQPINFGGTGASTAAAALVNLGGISGSSVNYIAATGTAAVMVLTPATPFTTFIGNDGITYPFIAAFSSTGSATLNVSGVGARAVRKIINGVDVDIAANDILAGVRYQAVLFLAGNSGSGAWIIVDPYIKRSVRRNRLVNPAMQISQQNGTTAGTTNNYFPADQWQQTFVTSAATLTVAQVASVTPQGSPQRIRGTVTVADASLAAGEFWVLTQNIEGLEVADFQYGTAAATKSVIRFGLKAPAGTYSIALQNAALNRSFIQTFVVSSANTDQYYTIPIPSGDTTGTWNTNTSLGISFSVVLAAGATFQGTNSIWQAGNILGTSGNTNGMGTLSSVFELFDVQFYLDPDGVGLAPVWELPQYNQVLPDCQRYWYQFGGTGVQDFISMAQATTTTQAQGFMTLPVPARLVSATSSGTLALWNAAGGNIFTSSLSLSAQDDNQTLKVAATVASGLVAGNASLFKTSTGGGTIVNNARF